MSFTPWMGDAGEREPMTPPAAVPNHACPECGSDDRPRIGRCGVCGAMLSEQATDQATPISPHVEASAPSTYSLSSLFLITTLAAIARCLANSLMKNGDWLRAAQRIAAIR